MLKFFKEWFSSLRIANESRHSDVTATESRVPNNASNRFAEDYNGFALSVYEQLSQHPGNVFFSPLSIRVACAMACSGARGETGAQMRKVLRLESTDSKGESEFGKLIYRLGIGGKKYQINLANALWSQVGEQLETEFVERMSRDYGGDINAVDFRGGDVQAARADINRWVEKKTNQKIQKLIPANGINAATRLILVNAVYFKGSWAEPFRKAATSVELFYPKSGKPMRVPLMYERTKTRYMETTDYQAVDLDYAGGDVSMLILLPEKNTLKDLEARLSVSMLDSCVTELSTCDVKLFLPRFKMTQGTELSSILHALGMPLAFSQGIADFSGINGHPPTHEEALFVSSVFHKAMVEVNEEGTEASAATAGRMVVLSRPQRPPLVRVFRADRPFLFAIREKKSGAILFLGRVENPERVSQDDRSRKIGNN